MASGEICQLLFTDGALPDVGAYYYLEKSDHGTGAQNRAFHALVMEFWRSGMHSYDVKSYPDFRNQIKLHLGEGFEAFIYVDLVNGKPTIHDVKKIEEIPESVKRDPDMKSMIRGRLKSWSDYTIKQRKRCIDNLIAEMHQAGVNSKKFEEILRGMESWQSMKD